MAICGVVDFTPFFFAFRASKSEFLIMLVTFVTTLLAGVDKGIMAGVALHIIILLQRSSAPKIKVLGRVPGTTIFRDVEVSTTTTPTTADDGDRACNSITCQELMFCLPSSHPAPLLLILLPALS